MPDRRSPERTADCGTGWGKNAMASSATRQRKRERVTIHEIAEQMITMTVGTSTMSSTVFPAASKSALSNAICV